MPDILYKRKLQKVQCQLERLLEVERMVTSSTRATLISGSVAVLYLLYSFRITVLLTLFFSLHFLFNRIYTEVEKDRMKGEAEREAKDLNLNCVRLCFEAFDFTHGVNNVPICPPVFSRSIANQSKYRNVYYFLLILSILFLLLLNPLWH